MSTATKNAEKDTKREIVLAIYKKHKDKEAHMPYREFRAAVVNDIVKQTGVENPGTLGMYFAWARREVLGRPAKQYNRSATRSANGAAKKSASENHNITRAVAQAAAARNAKAKKAKAAKTAKKSKAKSKAKKARK